MSNGSAWTRALLTLMGVPFLCTPPAVGQDDCTRGKTNCKITIDLNQPESPGNLTVDNRTVAEVELTNILPIEECSIVRDKRDVVPEPDVITELSKAVAAVAGVFTGFALLPEMPPDCQQSDLKELLELERDLVAFFRNDHRANPPACCLRDRIANRACALGDRINAILQRPRCTSTGSPQADAIAEAIKRVYGYFLRIRTTLNLIEKAPIRSHLQRLPGDRNATATYTAACKNLESGTPSGLPVTFTILYQDLPRVSFSVGALVSLVPKREVAAVSHDPGMVDKELVRVATMAEGESVPQAVPFSFLHVRLHEWTWRRRDYALNVSGSLGVNPNSGSNQAEFAVGPSVSIGRLNVFVGWHFARPQRLVQSFEDALPEDRVIHRDIPLPVERFWDGNVGFGISFRVF